LFFSACTIFAQYGIGIRTESELIGANQFTLNTKLSTKPGLGWNGGLSIRGNFYNILGHGLWYSIQRKQFYRRYKEQLLVNEDVNLFVGPNFIAIKL
jgi:hypothetical protein